MTMNVELTPLRSLAPAELKRLGAALESWFTDFLRDRPEVDGWIDQDALDDLLAGELPKPFILRCLYDPPRLNTNDMKAALEKARARHPLLGRSLPPAYERCVLFGFALDVGEADDLLASLRGGVPMELVAEIRINGETCKGEQRGGEI
jgi:hypothetical protein